MSSSPDVIFAFGMLTGVASALVQSCCYVVSGAYVKRTGKPGWTLTMPQRFSMAPFYALMVWFFRPSFDALDVSGTLLGCTCALLGILCGDSGLFQMQKTVEPSRAAPLQAVKIPIIALLAALALGQTFSASKIGGIVCVLASAALLCGAGRRIRLSAWGWLLACTFGYAVSDLSIGHVLGVSRAGCGGVLRSSLFSLGVTHLFCAAFALPGYGMQRLCGAPGPSGREWAVYVLPYGALWMLSMVFLFVCFCFAGVVPGTIAQSTRGLISVVLGWLLARRGFADVESTVTRAVFCRRVCAALLALAAMALYAW